MCGMKCENKKTRRQTDRQKDRQSVRLLKLGWMDGWGLKEAKTHKTRKPGPRAGPRGGDEEESRGQASKLSNAQRQPWTFRVQGSQSGVLYLHTE